MCRNPKRSHVLASSACMVGGIDILFTPPTGTSLPPAHGPPVLVGLFLGGRFLDSRAVGNIGNAITPYVCV